MFAALLALLLPTQAKPIYAPGTLWALNFASPPRIPLLGDVDADGYADLVCVFPPGDSIVDVSLNQRGQKAGTPFQGLTQWGKDCQAAVIGEFDSKPGADVAGLFDGQTIRLAGKFNGTKFTDTPQWAILPEKLDQPKLALIEDRKVLLAWSTKTGRAFRVRLPEMIIQDARVAPGFNPKDDRRPNRLDHSLPSGDLPNATTIQLEGDVDHDGDLDVVEFRYGKEPHTANAILLYRQISSAETDSDSDGLSNDAEREIGTDPMNSDTDGDGLLDGWETGSFRGIDLKALGCNPRHLDVVCLVSRFSNLKEADANRELERVVKFYADVDCENLDGTKGFAFHVVPLKPVSEEDAKKPWWELRDRFRPYELKGVVHWMQITPWGGGQADELGDGGGAGGWAAFSHEMGHQLGMDHTGFWAPAWCPTYSSLMNYAYSYGFEDSGEKIHFSDGRLKDFVLNETKLSEILPLPYDKVKFLEKGPYRFRLKPDGNKTLIDWNWNGVLGEKKVRADINYSYSTNAGRRDDVGKTYSAPWVFTHKGRAFALFSGRPEFKADKSVDPTISASQPGSLLMRRLIKPFQWEPVVTVVPDGLTGDPAAMSDGKAIVVVYPSGKSLLCRTMTEEKGNWRISDSATVARDGSWTPTLTHDGKSLWMFLHEAGSTDVFASKWDGKLWSNPVALGVKSSFPPGGCWDLIHKQFLLGVGQKQDEKRPNRWRLLRFEEHGGAFKEAGGEWVQGDAGGAAGSGRSILLFDPDQRNNGKDGRIYWFAQGLTSKESPWCCTYVAHTVADKTVHGGWMVKRFYDEWTQSRSAPAACWFNDDILWAYRWVDGGQGGTDNNLHVGYRASGIENVPMGDFDDIGHMRNFGMRASILYLNAPKP